MSQALTEQLRAVRFEMLERELAMLGIAKFCAQQQESFAREMQKLRKQEAAIDAELYWTRLQELIHTPCYRYRVTP